MTQPHTRIRIRFTKQADLRWISHRDLARLWERLLRRAEISLVFSQGFHPKPRISFPSALAVGIEGLDEVVELEVVGQADLENIRQRIADQMPPGMELLSIEVPSSKARLVSSTFRIGLPADELPKVADRIQQVLQSDFIRVDREGKQVVCSVRDEFFRLTLNGDQLLFTLPAVEAATLRPSELLQVLGLETLLQEGANLQRVHVRLDQETTSRPFHAEWDQAPSVPF